MKPAPPEDIHFQDPTYSWVVHSSVVDCCTEVCSPTGKTIWHFDAYIGQREIHVQPDGTKLVLFGSQYFGNTLRIDNAVEILQVVTPGCEPTNIYFDQIFGIKIEKAAKRKGDMVKGGGWIAGEHLCQLQSIDWSASLAVFVDASGTTHTVVI